MSDLWNPPKQVKQAIRSGDKKLKINHLKQQKLIEEVECPACGRLVYYSSCEDRFYTLSGSRHECVGLKQADRSAEFTIGE